MKTRRALYLEVGKLAKKKIDISQAQVDECLRHYNARLVKMITDDPIVGLSQLMHILQQAQRDERKRSE